MQVGEPQWHHDGERLAALHRDRFSRLIGAPLRSGWLVCDVAERGWLAGGPVVLGFGATTVEILHRRFDECAITWDRVDVSRPPAPSVGWLADPHAALRNARGRVLRRVNIIERLMPVDWRPRVLHAVEFLFPGARLAVYNAMDANGLTDVPERDLPVAFWRRIPVA